MTNYDKNRRKNQLKCNINARKEYDKRNFKYQSIKFKLSEIEDIDNYCKENNIPKNTLLRKAVMKYIGKSFS